jgi:hypothetical protein
MCRGFRSCCAAQSAAALAGSSGAVADEAEGTSHTTQRTRGQQRRGHAWGPPADPSRLPSSCRRRPRRRRASVSPPQLSPALLRPFAAWTAGATESRHTRHGQETRPAVGAVLWASRARVSCLELSPLPRGLTAFVSRRVCVPLSPRHSFVPACISLESALPGQWHWYCVAHLHSSSTRPSVRLSPAPLVSC